MSLRRLARSDLAAFQAYRHDPEVVPVVMLGAGGVAACISGSGRTPGAPWHDAHLAA